MNDTDRMQPIGKIPSIDYSTGTAVREYFQAYRDYDHVHLPFVVTDLDGIDRMRNVLDTAERDIRAYKARVAEADGDSTAADRALAALAGKHLGRANAEIGEAIKLLDRLLDGPSTGLTDVQREDANRLLGDLMEITTVNLLRRLCAVIEGTAPETAADHG